jgi:hypothetical protein
MRLIPSQFSFLLTLISLFLNTAVYGKTHGPLGLEKERCNFGRGIPPRMKSVKGKQWEVVNLTLKNAEISEYDKHTITTTKAWERVGGEGTLFPDAEGATLQKWQRRLKVMGEKVARVAIPFMLWAPSGAGAAHVLKYTTPLAVEYITDKTTTKLSDALGTDYLPYKEVITKELVGAAAGKMIDEFSR